MTFLQDQENEQTNRCTYELQFNSYAISKTKCNKRVSLGEGKETTSNTNKKGDRSLPKIN